jgi:membrane-associated phospholipid phosphatase
MFVTDQTKRWPLFTIAIISQIIGTWVSFAFGSVILTLYHLVYATTTLATALINIKTKVSIHIAGIAGPITFLAIFLGPLQMLWWVFVIPVAWSRLKLNAHTPLQLALGFFTAVGVTIGTLFFSLPPFIQLGVL